ncbi:MAG: acyl-CoA desaturase [Saprospiraceae bacterium]|nr:acyl-CoA desaturase [Saprospiraceae bacterium]
MRANIIKFSKPETGDFFTTLNRRVNDYFVENKISRHANAAMVFKTIVMLLLYFVPVVLIITATVTSPWVVFAMWCLAGIGVSGIGLSVMHDANHGAYSRKQSINNLFGYTLNFLGGNMMNWKIQHNVLHHSFTNVDGYDEDIEPRKALRFSPHHPWMKHHRYQHIYAWPLYALMTIMWITIKEFKQINRWKEEGIIEAQGRTYGGLFAELIVSKTVYYVYALVIPLVFSPVAWWVTVLGFITMHLISGLILALVFQPAHVVPEVDFPLAPNDGNMETSWAIHQLHTTCNFAPRNRVLSWFVGGLNHQIEHHLFPNVCHIHYKKLSPIVKQTALEFGLPYHEMPTFRSALYHHGQQLYNLGRLQPA